MLLLVHGGRKVQEKRENQKVKNMDIRIATLKVRSMTGKGYEMVEMMERRKLDMLCVKETKWKGSKARNLGGGYKLYYHGVDRRRNGVGIILKEEWTSGVIEVSRVTDRIMHMRVELGRNIANFVSAYAPQAGCDLEGKEAFWKMMDMVMMKTLGAA